MICGRRAAWLQIGGDWSDEGLEPNPLDFVVMHPVHVCGWCHVDLGGVENAGDRAAAVDRAARAVRESGFEAAVL